MWHLFGLDPAATGGERSEARERSTRAARRPAGRFLAEAYPSEAGSRRYKLYVPSGYAEQPLPLIVMLHGCKQDPDEFAAGTRMNALAEKVDCLVAYPEQSRKDNGMCCWNWRGLSSPFR